MSRERRTGEETNSPAGSAMGQRAAHRAHVELDISTAVACGADFCRAMGRPEEPNLDFALNSQPTKKKQMIEVQQRTLRALHQSVQHHEQVVGVLVMDGQERFAIGRRANVAGISG